MQQAQQREAPERISWARAMIFGVGFFFIAALLVGQIPGYIYDQATSATLVGLEQGMIALGVTCLAAFAIIQAIVMLFDPKPVVPPVVFSGLGVILTLGGLAIAIGAGMTGNQYFPRAGTSFASLLGGSVLWFQPQAIDLVMLGLAIFLVGAAWLFYSLLARRERGNPDRRDLGTTPAIRVLLIASIMILIIFMVAYTLVDDNGLAYKINPGNGLQTQLIIDLVLYLILGASILMTLGAFALRLHYLMRPVRKRTMAPLYAIGALGLAQIGAILLVLWIALYPLMAWMHTWTFIGLGDYLTVCAKKTAIPATCTFSQQAGYILAAIIASNSFLVLLATSYFWKTKRNLVVIGGIVVTAVLGLATLLNHTAPVDILTALLLSGGMLVLATIWTSVARREFAIVGENNLGCLGMWLVVGTCLLIYLAAFAFFSIPTFPADPTAPNVPFSPGKIVPPYAPAGSIPTLGQADAVVMMILMGALAAIQFYFLTRNRYKV
jgi:hypothetical protein